MTAVSPPRHPAHGRRAPGAAARRRTGFAGLLLAEWTKIRSVRSTSGP